MAGVITNWDTLKTKFEECFKPTEDEHALLAQLTQMKKDTHEGMHEFIAKFKKLVNRIPITSQPTPANLKCFFINTQLPEVSFLLRRVVPTNLTHAQALSMKIEDDLILAGKIWKDPNRFKGNSSSESPVTSSTDPMVQKLANELLALKKQVSQAPYAAPYNGIPRRIFPNFQLQIMLLKISLSCLLLQKGLHLKLLHRDQ